MNKKTIAKSYGKTAYQNRMPCAPALDKNLKDLLTSKPSKENISIMKAWCNGWLEEQLKGDI